MNMAPITAPKAGAYPDPKLHVSTGQLPPYVNPSEPPKKRSPWRQISQTPYINTASIVLPAELHDSIWPRLTASTVQAQYAKLFLKLEDILTGSFFTTYVKTPGSNIIMLSEGTPGVDNIFTLRDGVLRLDLVKQDYQRAGLQGKPVKTSGGRKHVKEYFRVEIDLRVPSMVKGKKGFERLLSACQNSLNQSLMWIFRDLSSSSEGSKDTMMGHHPQIIDIQSKTRDMTGLIVPGLVSNAQQLSQPPPVELLDDYYEVVEWLDLVTLDSPRIQKSDNPDPYISRYSVPGTVTVPDPEPTHLKVLTWTGLLDHIWLTRLLVDIIKQSRMADSKHWLAMTVTGHRTEAIGNVDGYALLLLPHDTPQEVNAHDEMDLDQPEGESEITGAESAEQSIAETKSHGGLQRFTCLQFVDS